MSKKDLKPVHPGEVLLEEFLKPMGLSQNRLALRLGRYFRMSPQIWLGLQTSAARNRRATHDPSAASF